MKKMIFICCLLAMPFSVWAQDEAPKAAEESAATTATSNNEATDQAAEESDAAPSDEADQKPNFPDLAGTVSKKVVCKLNNDEREISIVQDPEGPSSVVYKKNGEDKTIAYAKNDGSYVERVAEKIQTNLEAASFTCETAE